VPESQLFVDTNVFLRFLTADDERTAMDCKQLFERAEANDLELHTSHLALAEIVWTLQSYYRVSRLDVAAMIRDLLGLRSLRVDQKEMLRAVVDLYEASNVDFIDAYHALDLRRRGIDRICSYDRDFDSLGVARVEPADA
jgi:predicted nucleic-acid-binding protein